MKSLQLTFYSNSAEIFRQRGDILRANSTHHSSQVPWGSFPGSKPKLITPRTAETRNAVAKKTQTDEQTPQFTGNIYFYFTFYDNSFV